MSWQELAPAVKAAPVSAPVRIGVRQIKEAPSRAVILIKADVLALLGGGKTRRYRVALGSAEQKHQLRICLDEAGPFEPKESSLAKAKGTFRFVLPPLDRFPECRVAPQACDYAHDKGQKALIIDLPAWGWSEKIKIDVERASGVRP